VFTWRHGGTAWPRQHQAAAKPGVAEHNGFSTTTARARQNHIDQGRWRTMHRCRSVRPELQRRWGRAEATANHRSTRTTWCAVERRFVCDQSRRWRWPKQSSDGGGDRKSPECGRVRVRTKGRHRPRLDQLAEPNGLVQPNRLGLPDRWARGAFWSFLKWPFN
jgi:hypothetical protein